MGRGNQSEKERGKEIEGSKYTLGEGTVGADGKKESRSGKLGEREGGTEGGMWREREGDGGRRQGLKSPSLGKVQQ